MPNHKRKHLTEAERLTIYTNNGLSLRWSEAKKNRLKRFVREGKSISNIASVMCCGRGA